MFTPAPWKVMNTTRNNRPAIVAESGPQVAEVLKWTGKGTSDPDIIDANAKLIAAAPLLYEALKNLIDRDLIIDKHQDHYDEALEAIQKATGGT